MTDPSVHSGQDDHAAGDSPSPALVAAFVALMLVIAATLVALYALTPASSKPALLDTFKGWVPAGIVGLPAIAAAFGLHFARTKQLRAIGKDTADVKRQTNGVLDDRISKAIAAELDARSLGFPPVSDAPVIRDPEPTLPPVPGTTASVNPMDYLGGGQLAAGMVSFQGRGGG